MRDPKPNPTPEPPAPVQVSQQVATAFNVVDTALSGIEGSRQHHAELAQCMQIIKAELESLTIKEQQLEADKK